MSPFRLALGILSVLAFTNAETVSTADLLDTFLSGLREMEQHNRNLEDLLTVASEDKELAVPSASREELEDDRGHVDISASQESTKEETTKKPEEKPKPAEDDDDDIDDDEDDDDIRDTMTRGISTIFTSFPGILGYDQPKPWWRGPNVCVEREESEESSESDDFLSFGTAHFSTCQNTFSKYMCKTIMKKNGVTKTTVISYQCCHGYRMTQADPNTCTKVEIKSLEDIATDLGGDKFMDLIRSTGLQSELEGNVTIFMPTEDALSGHHRNIDSMNQLDPAQTNEVSSISQPVPMNEKSFVLGHVVGEVLESGDIKDEMVVTTKDNTTIRFSILPNRVITANCIKLNTTDRLTENGVVHLLDGVLEPVKENLKEKLSEQRFNKFRTLLEENDLFEPMSEGNNLFTVFAVDNEGVEMLGDKYKMCMKKILTHHILPHSLCSATAEPNQNFATLDINRSWLPFTKQDDVLIIGNNTRVPTVDMLATNGIVHVADSFVIPSGSRLISDLLTQTKHSEWLTILERSGLLSEIEGTENVTMFVPTNRAVKAAISEEMGVQELRELVRFHVGRKQNIFSVSTMLEGHNLTVSPEKSMFPGLLGPGRFVSVQCSPLTKFGGRVCNGLLHEVDSVLKPPTKNIWQFIQEHENLSTLRKVLEGTKIAEELKQGLDFTATFLAPTDDAFEELGEENYNNLLNDKTLADQIIRSHVIKEPICCNNVVGSSWPFVPTSMTLSGNLIEINRRGHITKFGTIPATECDNTVDGGIVHLVNGVRLARPRLHDRELILKRPNSEIILAGF